MSASMRLASAVAVVLCCACSNLRVSHDYDLDADFGALETYAWIEPDDVGPDELNFRRAVAHVDAELSAKGFVLVGAEGADFHVADFHVAVHFDTEQRVRVTDWGYGYDWRFASNFDRRYGARLGPRVDVVEYEEGVLFVDVVEPSSGHLIWRGVARRPIDESATPAERDARMAESVARILEPFPPGGADERAAPDRQVADR